MLKDASKMDVLIQWNEAQTKLAAAKEAELELRKQMIQAWFPEHKNEGTENITLESGWKLKAQFKVNRHLGSLEDVDAALEKIEAVDAEGIFVAKRIIRFKPELDKREYDACPDKYKIYIDQVLTTAEASPSLELVPPKVKK
jgi:hypothetical protein